ncbi:hypothetical protein TNCV_3292401 [Trichonephila clavipes]|nr:hypothetical protein TNCV_3292401 [Trichonephila clavipes]
MLEQRPLEEKSLPFSKKLSKVRITPVMRRVSRRSELPMASVQIPQPPVQIPQPPVQKTTCRFHNHLFQTRTCADSRCPRTCADSTCPTITCADSSVPCPRATCADSTCPRPPVQIPVSQVPQSPVQIPPIQIPLMQIPDVPEHVQIPVPQVSQPPKSPRVAEQCDVNINSTQLNSQPPMQIPLVHIPDVPEPVQIPVSQVPQSPVQIPLVPEPPVQLLPELDTLDPLESTDAFDQLMSFVFGPQDLQLLHTVPSIFDGDLFSFLDEFERARMDLTMPRLNSCVQNSIIFKPFQPMDLFVNSYIGQ